MTTAFAVKALRDTEEGRLAKARYCSDAAFFAAIDKRIGAPDRDPGLPDWRVDYVLTTGANWAMPIGDFRLVVDKGRPSNLVSFCAAGVRKISPTQFEVRHRNWRPTQDLHVGIVEPRWGATGSRSVPGGPLFSPRACCLIRRAGFSFGRGSGSGRRVLPLTKA